MIRKLYSLKNRFLPSVLLLTAVSILTACGDKQVATANTENDANLMFSILKKNGFNVAKQEKIEDGKPVGWDIIIREGYFGEGEGDLAIGLLKDFGLPRKPEPPSAADNPFGMSSEQQEKEKANRQLKAKVENLIYTMPDVVNVQAIIGTPENQPFSLEKQKAGASVIITVYSDQPKFTEQKIKELVAPGVPNLSPADISVQINLINVPESLAQEREELDKRRKANMILYLGIGVVLLLSAILGAILLLSKRRRAKQTEEPELLTEGEEPEMFPGANRPALTEGNEE